MNENSELPTAIFNLLDWFGSPELDVILVIFGIAMIGLAGYAHYQDRVSQSEVVFLLIGASAWIAYGIEGASSILVLPQTVASVLAGIAGLSFILLFLYWAHNRESESSG